jgi:farnesyl-diphosphate farnesyltransferase
MDWPLLKAVSRSFYITLRILPAPIRESVALAYLLARTSDTIADTASAPLDVRVRCLEEFSAGRVDSLSALSEWQTNPAEKTLIERSAQTMIELRNSPDEKIIRHVLRTIIGGQSFDLVRFSSTKPAPLTPAELDRYTYLVAGCVGEFWTNICAARIPDFSSKPATELLSPARRFGQGLQLVNILRDRPADAAAGRIYIPDDRVEEEFARARAHLDAGALYVHSQRIRRLRIACELPLALGRRTLDLITSNPGAQRVKASRLDVLFFVVRAVLRG